MEEKKFPVFDHGVDKSAIPQHLHPCKNHKIIEFWLWLEVLSIVNILSISHYL